MSKYSVVLAISLVFSSAYAEQQVVRDSGTYVFRGVTKKVVRLESGANTVTLGGANGHCVARTFGELFGCDDEMDGRFVGAEIYAETWEVDDWPFHLVSGVHKDSYNTRWIDSETDEDITDLLLPAGYFDVEMEITIAGGSDPVTHQAFDFEIPVIYDEYKDHGEGTYNVNPDGGFSGFYVGDTSLDVVVRRGDNDSITMGNRNEGFVGTNSFVSGTNNVASGTHSMAIGYRVSALGKYSLAMGSESTAYGDGSMAQGHNTKSYKYLSHAEGSGSCATGNYSHAEGRSTTSYGAYSHAEGDSTMSYGLCAHSEGKSTVASNDYSHAEGVETFSLGFGSHADGYRAIASNDHSYVWSGTSGGCKTNKTYEITDVTQTYSMSLPTGDILSSTYGMLFGTDINALSWVEWIDLGYTFISKTIDSQTQKVVWWDPNAGVINGSDVTDTRIDPIPDSVSIHPYSDPEFSGSTNFTIQFYSRAVDHGEGTFNINPDGGPDGFYIGNTNLSTHINSKIENELEEYWCKWDNTVLQGNSTNWIPTNWPARNIRCFVYIGASSDSTHSNVCIALPQWEPNEPRKLDFLVTKAAKCTNLVFKVAEGPATSSSYNFITYTTASAKYGWLELSYHPGVGWLGLPHTVAAHYCSTNGFRRTTVANMPSTWLPSGTGEGVLKFKPVPGGSVPEWEPPPPE